MPSTTGDFSIDMPGLAKAIEALPDDEINRLPFGVIHLDPDGRVLFYSDVERERSGYQLEVANKRFFVDIAPCFSNPRLKSRFERAMAQGVLDVTFDEVMDLPGGAQDVDLHIRMMSAADGGCWIFLQENA